MTTMIVRSVPVVNLTETTGFVRCPTLLGDGHVLVPFVDPKAGLRVGSMVDVRLSTRPTTGLVVEAMFVPVFRAVMPGTDVEYVYDSAQGGCVEVTVPKSDKAFHDTSSFAFDQAFLETTRPLDAEQLIPEPIRSYRDQMVTCQTSLLTSVKQNTFHEHRLDLLRQVASLKTRATEVLDQWGRSADTNALTWLTTHVHALEAEIHRVEQFSDQRDVDAQAPVDNAQDPVDNAQDPVDNAQDPVDNAQDPVDNEVVEDAQDPVVNEVVEDDDDDESQPLSSMLGRRAFPSRKRKFFDTIRTESILSSTVLSEDQRKVRYAYWADTKAHQHRMRPESEQVTYQVEEVQSLAARHVLVAQGVPFKITYKQRECQEMLMQLDQEWSFLDDDTRVSRLKKLTDLIEYMVRRKPQQRPSRKTSVDHVDDEDDLLEEEC